MSAVLSPFLMEYKFESIKSPYFFKSSDCLHSSSLSRFFASFAMIFFLWEEYAFCKNFVFSVLRSARSFSSVHSNTASLSVATFSKFSYSAYFLTKKSI